MNFPKMELAAPQVPVPRLETPQTGNPMRRHLPLFVVMLLPAVLLVAAPTPAEAARALAVTTSRTAFLLTPATVQVSGTLTCGDETESGSVGVVLIQPPGGVALSGGGSTSFTCDAGDTVAWRVVVNATDDPFTRGPARFDTFADTACSDDETDCPSAGLDGWVRITAAPTCLGETATIVGQVGDDRIEGTPEADVIVGLGGRDVVFGGEGDDVICGNLGDDVIDGGGGDDRMSGAAGPDFITGVDGDDELRGGPGDDVLNFGDEEDGDDLVAGGDGDDDLHAGVGRDRLFGNAGDDSLREGEVDAPVVDLFSGGPGVDTCSAGAEDVVRQCEGPAALVSLVREEQGASVLVTITLTCPPQGPGTDTYFALTLAQRPADAPHHVEGFGGIVAPPSPIVCDDTRRSYTFNVRPSEFYADERFTAGPATAEWSVITCTLVDPETTNCTGTELVREQVFIRGR
jgi:Ca2+-binding RTX toxin-like protein